MASPQLAPDPRALRSRILVLLTGFSVLSYVVRVNVSIAQHTMGPDLGLSDEQIGVVLGAFTLGYTCFQVHAGAWADRRGIRIFFSVAAIAWAVTTLLAGLVPRPAAFVSLLVLRLCLGVTVAGMFPAAAMAIGNWFPGSLRVRANAIVCAGAPLGVAVAEPLIAGVMHALGWRATFYVSALLPIPLALLWWKTARDRPADRNDRVSSDASLWTTFFVLLKNRQARFLYLSYFLDSYVLAVFIYWLFKYLVDERRFGVLQSGWVGSIPYVLAIPTMLLTGLLGDRLSAKHGSFTGRRFVAMGCLLGSAALLLAGIRTEHGTLAIACLAGSIALVLSTESSYWTTAVDLAKDHAGASGGLMNVAGNLGVLVSSLLVPALKSQIGWNGAFGVSALCAVASAIFWVLIRSARSEAKA